MEVGANLLIIIQVEEFLNADLLKWAVIILDEWAVIISKYYYN